MLYNGPLLCGFNVAIKELIAGCMNRAVSWDTVRQLDCDQRPQTSAKTSNLDQMYSRIAIRISELIRIRIWTSAKMLWIHYLSASVTSWVS